MATSETIRGLTSHARHLHYTTHSLTQCCEQDLSSLLSGGLTDSLCVQIKKINDIPTSMKGAVIACCLFSPIMVAAIMCYEKYVKKNI